MKKATILALATIAIFVASCGNGASTSTTTDSTTVDSTLVKTDSTVVDTAKADTSVPYHTPIN